MSEHVKLAAAAVQAYVVSGREIDVPQGTAEELLSSCAGTFVCLKINGQLRGCIGTIEPACECIAKEIISNAISAAVRDPRFMPVDASELESLEYSVDVLGAAEMVDGIEDLDPKRFGVIVENGMRRGLLLPDLEGVDTAEMQVDIARHKAFITTVEPIKLYRFEVKRYH